MIYDAVIIDSPSSYKNIAFDFGIVSLRLEDRIMTVQSLISLFQPDASSQFEDNCLNLESCGKLNGIFLFHSLTKAGYSCALLSNVLDQPDKLASLLQEGTRSVIISTTWTFGIESVKEIIKVVRSYDQNVPIIVGGVLVFNSYLLFKQLDNSDIDTTQPRQHFFFLDNYQPSFSDVSVFIFDRVGYKTLASVLRSIKDGLEIRGISNTAFYDGNRPVFSSYDPEPLDLNDQAIDWNAIDGSYLSDVVPVQLSMGCSHGCKFCNFFFKRMSFRKSKRVIEKEIGSLLGNSGVKMIRFVDDNMPPSVIRDVCEVMIGFGSRLPWSTFVRLDALDADLLTLMKKANCADIQVGVESGDDQILKGMAKGVTSQELMRQLDLIGDFDISVRCSFVLGFPGECADSIDRTIEFINRLPTDRRAVYYIGFAPFMLLPLAPIYSEGERSKYDLRGYLWNWQHSTLGMADVPALLKKIFLSVRDGVLFAYTGDPVNWGLPRDELINVQVARQRYQKAVVSGKEGAHSIRRRLWSGLREAVDNLVRRSGQSNLEPELDEMSQ